MTCQVQRRRGARSKDKARGVDVTHCRLASKIGHGLVVRNRQPKNAGGYFREKTHPAIEHSRKHLVLIVEATKDESTRRQLAFLARRCRPRQFALRITWKET